MRHLLPFRDFSTLTFALTRVTPLFLFFPDFAIVRWRIVGDQDLSILRGHLLFEISPRLDRPIFSLERERKRNLERDRTIVERERIFFLFHFTNGRTTTTTTTTTIPFDIEFSSGETKKRGWVSVKRDRREGKHPSIVRAKILRDKWRARSMHASSSPSKKV